MTKSTQKTFTFFLVALSGMLLLNCKSNQEEAQAVARAKARELVFIKKQADYVGEHGHKKEYDLKTGRVQE
ncbi:hypothetical protein [Acinetobacter indicus]|nr:hypothetical protein [Acinetobacter indicus]MDM1292573.1 hypothetical protein [Acinetobacter indicus]MDM1322587.1 hypothetical protein [Acinetobacter indicus]MDM1334325.1 hypothetical protein [Acinetobacter indicus]QIZ60496.1 hypothetical protein FK537_15345 [Acinetobacter indicus]